MSDMNDMKEEVNSDLFTISDDEGHDLVLEHLDSINLGGTYFLAFLPTDIPEDDERYGLIILKAVNPAENTDLVVPTEAETQAAYEAFLPRLFPDEDNLVG